MKKHQAGPATDRRQFLTGIVAVSGATALTTFCASRLMAADSGGTAVRKDTDKVARGYHETDHIRDYYRTLKT